MLFQIQFFLKFLLHVLEFFIVLRFSSNRLLLHVSYGKNWYNCLLTSPKWPGGGGGGINEMDGKYPNPNN